MQDVETSGLSVTEKQLIRDKARWMSLEYEAVSPEALALVDKLRIANERERPSSTLKSRTAMAAVVADLLIAHIDNFWSIRALSPNGFTGQRIGFRPFDAAISRLEFLGHIERLAGYTDRSGFGPTGRATCFRLTQRGLETVLESGIAPKTNFAAHFKKTQGKEDR